MDEGELKRRVQRELATWLAVTHKAISGDTPLRTSDQDLQALAKQPMQEATFPPSTQHVTICGDLVILIVVTPMSHHNSRHDAGATAEHWLMLCIALIFCML